MMLRPSDAAPEASSLTNYDAEKALLGAILANNLVYDRVNEFLRPEHFADSLHGRIYEAIGRLTGEGKIANAVTLKNLFDQDGALAEIGGARYLVDLSQSVVTVINADDYGHAIHGRFLARSLAALGQQMVEDAGIVSLDETELQKIERYSNRVAELSEVAAGQRPIETASSCVGEAIAVAVQAAAGDGVAGLPTGLTDFDRLTGGLHPGLHIGAGRPSMGKSTWALNVADHVSERDRKAGSGGVLFVSREMSGREIGMKLLAARTGIPTDDQLAGRLSSDQIDRLRETERVLKGLPLLIDDRSDSVPAIASRARRLRRTGRLSLIVLDYLHLLNSVGRIRAENRVQEISQITRGLKLLAQELDIPVLALSQLSRAVEQRDDKRPILADLRDSGSIEQDADSVIFLYRHEYYVELAEPRKSAAEDASKFSERLADWNAELDSCRNIAELIIAKQRLGRRGPVRAHFDGVAGRFSNLGYR
jgi:replicative DNA helicase